MKKEIKYMFIAIILFSVIYSIIVGFMLRENRNEEANKILLENKRLIEDNKAYKSWNGEMETRFSDRCDIRVENERQNTLIFAKFYIAHESIINGLLCEENCNDTKEGWKTTFYSLDIQKDYYNDCTGIIDDTLKTSEKIGFKNNCY